MIRLFATGSYTREDYQFLLESLMHGHKPCVDGVCDLCKNKVACADLARLIAHVVSKADAQPDRRGKREAE